MQLSQNGADPRAESNHFRGFGASSSALLARAFARFLERAGVTLDGPAPWDPQIHDRRLFARGLLHGTLGLGEAYMDGWWDCAQPDELFARVLRSTTPADRRFTLLASLRSELPARLVNLQRPQRASRSVSRHYDAGADLFEAMLDRRMVYSCAYWRSAATLDEAQEAKLDLVCRKLGLQRGMRLLDIGCGWGGLAHFAAERYGAQVVGITLSRAQAAVAERRCAGLPVEIRLQDYRSVAGTFDRIASLGMLEHVGPHNYRAYMEVVRRCLADDGLALVHTIGNSYTRASTDPWLSKYVFPDAVLPSIKQLGEAMEGVLVMEDWHNFGADYDRTLCAWHANVERAWPQLPRYDERFRRMWRYYLLTCAGTFRARANQLWQIVLSKRGVPGGYASVR